MLELTANLMCKSKGLYSLNHAAVIFFPKAEVLNTDLQQTLGFN